jgi:hypothetical protein
MRLARVTNVQWTALCKLDDPFVNQASAAFADGLLIFVNRAAWEVLSIDIDLDNAAATILLRKYPKQLIPDKYDAIQEFDTLQTGNQKPN